MDIRVYWERKDPAVVGELEFKASVYNNLFGAGFMSVEMMRSVEGLREQIMKDDHKFSLFPAELNSYITSLERVCSPINLKISPATSIASSLNILLRSDSSLHPYKKLQNFWVSLDPSLASPVLLPWQDFQNEIQNFPNQGQVLNFSFNPSLSPSPLPLPPITILPIHPPLSYSELLVCKANKQFIKFYYQPSTTVLILLSHLKQTSRHANLHLWQKLGPRSKRSITEGACLISSLIQDPKQNILFCTLN